MTWELEHGGNLSQQTSLLDVCLLKSHLRKSCPMDHSSTASPNLREDSPDSGNHTPNLWEDKVKILENNLKEWVATDKAKKQSIIQNIADNIKRLPPNRRLKSREWVIKKKVSNLLSRIDRFSLGPNEEGSKRGRDGSRGAGVLARGTGSCT